MKILDCTLRDGGYYTNWDFERELTTAYFESLSLLPVDIIEIGYRSRPLSTYLGEYFYCPEHVIQGVRQMTNKSLAVMLNEKDVKPEDIRSILSPCEGVVDLVRLAVDPREFKRAFRLALEVKKYPFKVGFNVMYMSSWSSLPGFKDILTELDGVVDYLYMVDSYGGVYPNDVKASFDLLRSHTAVPIGFHGHNNLELALINSLTALECGAEIVDATVTGMGRGAGNLKTELLLTTLSARGLLDFDFNVLSRLVDPFIKLQEFHDWGTNLPYMVSGANSLPQKEVMDWVSTRYYSFNSIIRALSNRSRGLEDNLKLHILDFGNEPKVESALIVGGGPSSVSHRVALHQFLRKNPQIDIIHASSKNALGFRELTNRQFYCLVGNEGHRLEKVFGATRGIEGKCVLPPYPRRMGTYIPETLLSRAFELSRVDFTDKYKDAHTALALQTAVELGVNTLYFTGYDGYGQNAISQREQDLFMENEYLFERIRRKGIQCNSITPTNYTQLSPLSVYSLL